MAGFGINIAKDLNFNMNERAKRQSKNFFKVEAATNYVILKIFKLRSQAVTSQ